MRLNRLYMFGTKIFFADQLEQISNHFAALLIGKNFSSIDLGYYTKAVESERMISNTALISINKVVFPTFSKIQSDNKKLKKGYRSIIKATTFFLFPISIYCFLVAESLIPFLLGNQWYDSIIYFKLFCIGGMTYPFTLFNLNIIKVKGMQIYILNYVYLQKGF